MCVVAAHRDRLLGEHKSRFARDDGVYGASGMDAVPKQEVIGLIADKRCHCGRDARVRDIRQTESLGSPTMSLSSRNASSLAS
jgi:hypothetical protein